MSKEPGNLKGRPAFVIVPGLARSAIGAKCSKCGIVEAGSDKINSAPVRITKHFVAKGWEIVREGVAATCPNCRKRADTPHRPRDDGEAAALAALERQQQAEARRLAVLLAMPGQAARPASAPAPVARPATMPQPAATIPIAKEPDMAMPSKAAAIAHRTLYHLLDEHFEGDGKVGTYYDGWDDRRVARETGLSVSEVAAVREQAYGRVIDPAISKLRADIVAEHTRITRDYGELKGMLEAAQTASAERLAALAERLQQIEARRLG